MIGIVSIIMIAKLSSKLPFLSRYEWFFLTDCNKPLPLLIGVMAFVFFKKLHLQYIPIINIMGGSTFGVLLIHANSDTMRRWLWRDVLHNVDMYNSPWLVAHAIVSVLVIFIICVAIDYLRIRFVEPPLLEIFNKLWPSIVKYFNNFESWFTKKTQCFIGE